MNYRLEFRSRDAIRTVSLAMSHPTLREAENSAQRLRSWAMIREVPIAGAPIMALGRHDSGRVHLPIATTCNPHPETGIELDELPARQEVIVPDVRFAEIASVQEALRESCVVDGIPEFHSLDRDFLEGEVRIGGHARTKEQQYLPLDQASVAAAVDPAPVAARASATIAIAAQPFSGGEAVAAALAQKLGLTHIDNDALSAGASAPGFPASALESAHQRRSFFQRVVDQMSHISPMAEYPLAPSAPQVDLITRLDCHRRWEAAISAAAARGGAVISAHGATFALARDPRVMRILVTAPDAVRARRLTDSGASSRNATCALAHADRDIAQVIDEYYAADWLNATHYDLVLNVERLDTSAAARFISEVALQFTHDGRGRSAPARTPARQTSPVTSIPFGVSVPAPSL